MEENLSTLSFSESNLLDPLVYLTKIPGKKVRTKLIQVCRYFSISIHVSFKQTQILLNCEEYTTIALVKGNYFSHF
jgi:hypothetical protein